MKSLKFKPHLCQQIIEGAKTSTWRLYDDKDLQVKDVLTFINKETLEVFGQATVTILTTKTLGALEDGGREGYEKFAYEEIMHATYRQYYGDGLGSNTEVKILTFDFMPIL